MTFLNMIGRIYSFEPKVSEGGVKYTDLRLSVKRPYKNYNGTYDNDFFRIALFEHHHDSAQKYFKKGMGIALKGRLENSRWKDKDENERFSNNIIVESIIFLPKDIDFETASEDELEDN